MLDTAQLRVRTLHCREPARLAQPGSNGAAGNQEAQRWRRHQQEHEGGPRQEQALEGCILHPAYGGVGAKLTCCVQGILSDDEVGIRSIGGRVERAPLSLMEWVQAAAAAPVGWD